MMDTTGWIQGVEFTPGVLHAGITTILSICCMSQNLLLEARSLRERGGGGGGGKHGELLMANHMRPA